MKFIVVVVLVACAVAAYGKPHHDGPRPELPPKIKAAHDKCAKELGLTDEQLEERRKNHADQKEDCFKACVFKELGILGADGSINKEKALENAPPHLVKEGQEKIFEACHEKKGANDCETAALVQQCLRENLPHHHKSPEMEKLENECKAKLSLSDDDLHNLRKNGANLKEDCFGACILKGSGVVNEDGSFNKEKALGMFPPHVSKEVVQKAIDECHEIKGANECESAALQHKCFEEHKAFGDHPHPPPTSA